MDTAAASSVASRKRVAPDSEVDEEPHKVTKMSPIEHALHAGDFYIDQSVHSVSPKVERFVWNPEHQRFEFRAVQYPFGLLKIFDEALVNAGDNVWRGTRRIAVQVDDTTISVRNDGPNFTIQPTQYPSRADPTQKAYEPEVAFFHCMSSTAYTKKKRVTGGKFGLGAKLIFIYSTHAVVEMCDGETWYRQECRQHMREVSPPRLRQCGKKGAKPFVHITFTPDLSLFYPLGQAPDVFSPLVRDMFSTRVVDLAGTTPRQVLVKLNGQNAPVRHFKEYFRLFLKPEQKKEDVKLAFHEEKRWQVCAIANPYDFPVNVSFVNNINTYLGGQHVRYLQAQVVRFCQEKLPQIDARRVHQSVMLFVNATIEDPLFNSQSKTELRSLPPTFGSTCVLPPRFLNVLGRNDVLSSLKEALRQKELAMSRRKMQTQGAKKNSVQDIPDSRDARFAGRKNKSAKCTLFLVEGKSAFHLAEVGLAVIGSDYNGALALRGKVINAESSVQRLTANKEFCHICRMLGLEMGRPTPRSQLRYGRVVFLTDQDYDASHIQALLLWMFACHWPHLLREKDFLVKMITPIIIARPAAKKSRTPPKPFFTIPSFRAWWDSLTPGQRAQWHTKYYKGLATSNNKEGRYYFSHLAQHLRPFRPANPVDFERLRMVMSLGTAAERRLWLQTYDRHACIPYDLQPSVSISQFVDQDLKHYSWTSIVRGIPLAEDGLTQSARKCLWVFLQKDIRQSMKIATAQSVVDKTTNYHYGPDSLGQTIARLTQQFTGKQNLNFLVPDGQTGSRVDNGKSKGSSRYTQTRLQPITRLVFPADDDQILLAQEEEGKAIEPEALAPIIPTVLVNGVQNLGTGYASKVPCYRPEDLIAWTRQRMRQDNTDHKTLPDVPKPWYHKFRGDLQESVPGSASFVCQGLVENPRPLTYVVTELPLGTCKAAYKPFLMRLKEQGVVDQFFENHPNTDTVRFEVKTKKPLAHPVQALKLECNFKANLNLFALQDRICTFSNIAQILEHWYQYRRLMYEKRRAFLQQQWRARAQELQQKCVFVAAVVEHKIPLRASRPQMEERMAALGIENQYFTPFLRLSLLSFTDDQVRQLHEKAKHAQQQIKHFAQVSIGTLWNHDLQVLQDALPAFYESRIERNEENQL